MTLALITVLLGTVALLAVTCRRAEQRRSIRWYAQIRVNVRSEISDLKLEQGRVISGTAVL